MSRLQIFPAVIFLALILNCEYTYTQNPVPPNATESEREKNQPEGQSVEQRFTEALDEFEQEIERLERSGKYGLKEVEEFADQLKREYFSTAKILNLDTVRDYQTLSASERQFYDRLNSLSIALWYLEYIGPQISSDKNSTRTIVTRLHKIMSEHSQAMRDRNLAKRFHDLSRRASQINHRSFVSRYQNIFHFVRPSDRGVSETAPPLSIEESQSPIQVLSAPIRRLLRLEWSDGQLALDEDHWAVPFDGQTLQQVDEQILSTLAKRGLANEKEDRTLDIRKRQLFSLSYATLLFQNLQYQATGGGPTTGSSSILRGPSQTVRFSAGGIDASLSQAANSFEFFARESQHANQNILQLSWKNNNELQIRIIGKRVLILEQNDDGQVRWIDIDQVTSVRDADSFAQLYAKFPKEVDEELFPYLQMFGIMPPMSRFDDRITHRVIDHLKGTDDETRKEFEELTEKLDSGSFGERQNAYRSMTEDFQRFSILIEQTPEEKFASTETSSRFQEIRKKYATKYREIDALIRQAGWLENADYLVKVAERIGGDHRTLLTKRLSEIAKPAQNPDP